MTTYFLLFYHFFKTGLFSIGGGLATLPFLYNISDVTGWYTYDELANMLAVSESTPGAIGINMATYVGYTVGGIPGTLLATLSEVAPGIVVILIIARFLDRFRSSRIVDSAFYGLRPASVGLIASIGITVGKIVLLNAGWTAADGLAALLNYKSLILAVLVLAGTIRFKNLSPIVFIVISAAAGILFSF